MNIRNFCYLLAFLYASQVNHAYASDREIALKAGLIFNFAVYSKGDWFTPEKYKNYLICSPDLEFVKVARQTLKNKKIRNSYVLIKHIDLNDLKKHDCNSIFLSANTNKGLEHKLFIDKPFEVMLIGESDGFIERGGHINFFLAGGKARFEIDPIGLHDNNIDISSKVIRLGKVITRDAND